MNAEYVKPTWNNIEVQEDTRIPAFREIPVEVEKKQKTSDSLQDENVSGDSSEPVITFGDELEVPAFIRNRRE